MPYKTYKQREVLTPWMTAEIYSAMRERERLVQNFKYTRSNLDLINLRQHQNLVNTMVENAKKNYIQNTLNQNTRNPKKFWKLIN